MLIFIDLISKRSSIRHGTFALHAAGLYHRLRVYSKVGGHEYAFLGIGDSVFTTKRSPIWKESVDSKNLFLRFENH